MMSEAVRDLKRAEMTNILNNGIKIQKEFNELFDDLTIKISETLKFRVLEKIKTMRDYGTNFGHFNTYFFEADGLIKGFTMIVSVCDYEQFPIHTHIFEKLNINKDSPMILICSVMKPVAKIKKCRSNIRYLGAIGTSFPTKEEMKDGYFWVNFEDIKNDIEFDKEFVIKNRQWTKSFAKHHGYPRWKEFFSEAKIKILSLTDISNDCKIACLAKEIMEMTV
jgi:hypothetical protein